MNLSAYYMQWDNVQFGIFNPTEQINTTFGINGANFNVKGIEAQFIGKVTEGLTIQGSGSYNDDTQANSPCLVDNISGTASYGKCITQVRISGGGVQAFANPFGTLGSTPPPSRQASRAISGRVTTGSWAITSPTSQRVQAIRAACSNQPASYPSGAGVLIPGTTQLRYEQPAYATFDASLGVKKDKWTAEIYGHQPFRQPRQYVHLFGPVH